MKGRTTVVQASGVVERAGLYAHHVAAGGGRREVDLVADAAGVGLVDPGLALKNALSDLPGGLRVAQGLLSVNTALMVPGVFTNEYASPSSVMTGTVLLR